MINKAKLVKVLTVIQFYYIIKLQIGNSHALLLLGVNFFPENIFNKGSCNFLKLFPPPNN